MNPFLFIFLFLLTYTLIMGSAKLVRDIILFRYSWSVFTCLPQWLQRLLLSDPTDLCKVCDGFHVMDGIIAQAPYLAGCWLANGHFGLPQWYLVPEWGMFWLIFYAFFFNTMYHYVMMKKPFRGRTPAFRPRNVIHREILEVLIERWESELSYLRKRDLKHSRRTLLVRQKYIDELKESIGLQIREG